MPRLLDYLWFAPGLALLLYGGDRLVTSSVRLALAFGLRHDGGWHGGDWAQHISA